MSTSDQSPPNENKVPHVEPEPEEGGPLEREQAFLEQRFAVLQPREAPSGEPTVVPSPDEPPVEGAEEKGPLPPDFRQKLMAAYRRRQQATLPPTDPEASDEAPPEAPAPSDVN
jgi:hypothetical protein